MAPVSLQSHPGDSQAKDFTGVLPFQLSVSILGLLDHKSLDACSAVNGRWAFLVRQLQEDRECRTTVQKNLLHLKLCPRKAIPKYARRVDVQIPQLNEEGEAVEVKQKEQKKRRKSKTEDFSLHEAYQGLKTAKIELEERNVFCGPYKTHVLLEQAHRRAHHSGGDRVAAAHWRVRLLGVPAGQDVPLVLPGHAGPCRALCLREDEGILLSTTSCDLSIRCWDIHSSACVRTFSGHYATVTGLHSHQERLVSGAADGMVKVWSLKSGKCLRTLMHSSPVWAVSMDGTHVVSGGHRGLVKVWSAQTGALVKTLERHQGPVLCLSFDQWHLLTGSTDGYALGWSMLGKFRRCLMAFFHPKEVLSLEFLYLRVTSGCADGHIRVFSFLTGACLHVLEPGSSGDPASALYAAGNRLWCKFNTFFKTGTVIFQLSDKADPGPAPPAPEEPEATEEYELPQAVPSRPMSPDKLLPTISTLQGSCRAAVGSPSPELPVTARGEQQPHPGKVLMSQRLLQQQQEEEQAAQLQRAGLHSPSLAMTTISAPFESKTLRLRLRSSLHGPAVKSSIPAPCLVRPRLCGSLGERKALRGHGKGTAGPKDGGQLIDICAISASLELVQPAPGAAAQGTEAPGGINPSSSRRDSGFRLLAAEQELQEAALAAQHQAQQAKPTADKERVRRKAWLRKSRGLPVDAFTGEKKTPAPELGHDTFI
ncbi:F-box and WD repeat domain containing protein 10B [Chamaea fasciata]|uniref:F-box and WD repeat domain containing protein 10B n=1 Tax=Chamaea fasciata TaxID=190680 RepID=UPI00336AD044